MDTSQLETFFTDVASALSDGARPAEVRAQLVTMGLDPMDAANLIRIAIGLRMLEIASNDATREQARRYIYGATGNLKNT